MDSEPGRKQKVKCLFPTVTAGGSVLLALPDTGLTSGFLLGEKVGRNNLTPDGRAQGGVGS